MQEVQTISIVLLGLFFFLSALFSGTEAAFLASQRHRIRHLASTGSTSAAVAERMMERPERFLSAVLVGNNLFNTAAAALATAIAVTLVENSDQAVVAATIVTTILLLLVAEITPKTIAARHAERVLIIMVRPFQLLSLILTPVSFAFSSYAVLVARIVRGHRRTLVNVQDLRTLVRVGVEEGTVERREADLVQKVFQFGDRMVREVMTPRTEIVWVRHGTTLAEFLEIYQTHAHSSFPVNRDETDDVDGILSIKDVLRANAAGRLTVNSSVTTDIRDALFVPETKPIVDLLEDMRGQRTRMAIVVDEFGGIAGLVTLSRVIEEIVGRVDEPGEPQAFQAVDERTVRVDGILRIDELAEQLDIHLPEGDGGYETIAGFILNELGRIPLAGDELAYGAYHLTVARMQGARIDEVMVRTEKAPD